MRLTAKQAADRLNISYVVASGLMSHLEDVGKAKVVEKVFHVSGKGKPTRVYEVDNNVVLNFGEDILQPAVVEDTAPVAVETEVAVEVAAEIVPMVAETEVAVETTEEIVPTVASEGGYWDDEDEDEDMAA
jgi:hypothetical protein